MIRDKAALDRHRRDVYTNDGVRLSVIDTGHGQPFLILPAWSNAAIEYWRQIDDFARDHRVIAVDMRGHGASEKCEHGYRVSRLAADLEDLLSELDVTDAVVMGHSMGCSVIWAYLDLFGPEKLARLILVDQAATQLIQPWWTRQEQLDYGCCNTIEDIFDLCADLAGPAGEQKTRDLFLGLFTSGFPAEEAEAIVEEVLKMPRRHAAALMLDHAPRDWRDVISRIELPTLVVGARKSVFPAESQEWIASRIPGAALEIFEEADGGSHFMCMENAGRFNAVVRGFLAN
ncbi:alpha/beta hydrolase [Rhizobiales bacterium]|uniref:alpha/beta fold hydrolase n=1 Tax=Hongsoonwoonella zoysiae TaxID=2821844 RepID=UPI0015604C9C|nr:alpha/beta hydrolase [Hongsoonwoonella zoysiae]NRG18566.1 alpha/beta hydrolase [Hongsoonwoonella zoysiae]